MRSLFISRRPLSYNGFTRNYFACSAALKRLGVSVTHLVPRSSRSMILEQLAAVGDSFFLSPVQIKKALSSGDYDRILVFGRKTWIYSRSDSTGKCFRFPLHSLPDQADLPQYQFSPDFHALYRCALSLENTLVVGQVGELDRKNNQDFSLMVFRNLLKINKNSRLLLVGDGPLRMELKAQIDYEYLPVQMPGDTLSIQTMLTAMDVLLFPSEKIDPFLLEEALASGLPCLVPEHAPGIKDGGGIIRLDLNAGSWAETIASINVDHAAREIRSKRFLENRVASFAEKVMNFL